MKTLIASALAAAFALLACRALAQESAEAGLPQKEDNVARFGREMEKLKRSVASPSYGLMVFHGRVRPVRNPYFTSSLSTEGILLQGLDLRFFVGKNVTTRGGFYSGIESGVWAYVPPLFPGLVSFADSVTVSDPNTMWIGAYEARVKVDGAFAFLMGKYGFRIDTGPPLYGLGFGVEMGMGAGIRSGGVDVYVGDRRYPIAKADLGSIGGPSLLFDAALEASLRMGRNFRLFGKLGLIVLPQKDTVFDPSRIDRRVLEDGLLNSPEEYMRYALQNYVVEIDAFAYELRAGFALSFN